MQLPVWLSATCIPERYTPAWVSTQESCIPGITFGPAGSCIREPVSLQQLLIADIAKARGLVCSVISVLLEFCSIGFLNSPSLLPPSGFQTEMFRFTGNSLTKATDLCWMPRNRRKLRPISETIDTNGNRILREMERDVQQWELVQILSPKVLRNDNRALWRSSSYSIRTSFQ